MMPRFLKSDIDDVVIEHLKKLNVNNELLLNDIKKEHLSAIKCFDEDCLCGILLIRGAYDYDQQLTAIICHAIASPGMNLIRLLTDEDCFFKWLESSGFASARFHCETKAMASLYGKVFDSVESVVFIKRFASCQNQNPALAKNPAQQQQIKINELPMRAE